MTGSTAGLGMESISLKRNMKSIHPKVVTILVKDKGNVIKKNQKKVLLLVLQFLQVSM